MTDKKTGIFYVKNPTGVLVLQEGREIARYENVQQFVAAHEDGLTAIKQRDEALHDAIAAQYDPLGSGKRN